MRVYAVGDIHGELALLDQVLDFLRDDAAAARARGLSPLVVFLGDYVDRGPHNRGVLDRLIALADETWCATCFLAGNHEAAMLAFLDDPVANAAWLGFGGIETLANYGIVAPPGGASAEQLRQIGGLFGERLPDDHRRFLLGLEPMAVAGDYVFVHAGLRPGVPLERQHRDDLLWIRDDFTAVPYWHGKRVVHGHTIEIRPAVHPWRIGIDTGAYATGALCCLILEGAGADPMVFGSRR